MNLAPVIPGRVSDALYDATISKLNADPMKYSDQHKNQFIHLIDAISRGYATPGDGWDAVMLGYVPEHLLVRTSLYQHLV